MQTARFLSLSLLSAVLASCAPQQPAPQASTARRVAYRYENTLDLRADNTLNHVQVLGYEDPVVHEATSLAVSAGGTPLTLRNQVDVNGAMYNPSVELTKRGNLVIHWGVIDDGSETVELAADPAGNLTIVKRSHR